MRHGQTAENVQGVLLGHADPPLTDAGREQARRLAAELPRPTLVVSSPLQRARVTAEAFGEPVRIDERWIELDYGELDGRSPSACRRTCGSAGEPTRPTPRPAASRCSTWASGCAPHARSVSEAAASGTVVVVTHVSPIKAAVAWALEVPDDVAWRMYVEDASVTRIDIEPRGPVVRWFNRGFLRDD